MALVTQTVWEVRPTAGSDTNGGGFVCGASGTDYSKQNSAQITYTDLVIDGTTNTKCTSAGNPFTSAHVGNLINITSGTGFSVQRVYVVSVLAGVATCDKSLGTLSSTGGNGKLGGAFATLAPPFSNWVNGNTCFIKASGTLSCAASNSVSGSQEPSVTLPFNRVIGYTTTRGDNGKATLQATAGSVTLINLTGSGWLFENLILDCNNQTGSVGITGSYYTEIRNCVVKTFKSTGINCLGSNFGSIVNCEITAGVSGADYAIKAGGSTWTLSGNYIHDNACSAVLLPVGQTCCSVIRNVIVNNTGATSDGLLANSDGYTYDIQQNTFYGNGRDAIRFNDTKFLIGTVVKNNIFVSNVGYGINATTAGTPAMFNLDGNAYYNNTAGATNNINDTGSTNPVNGAGQYTYSLDQILSGDPFTNSAGEDFTLNNTVGAGAQLRGAGVPTGYLGATGTNYLDMGAFQHQATASGGGTAGFIGDGLVSC